MAATAEKTDPALWARVKAEVTAGDKGGEPDTWSARKAQLAVSAYKKAGGGYKGKKTADNHLLQWEHEDWGTKSGAKSKDTSERYLPKRAREALSDDEYKRTSAKKRADKKKGHQFSPQPPDIAQKTATKRAAAKSTKRSAADPSHKAEPTLAELRRRAAQRGVAGRSHMNKSELARALEKDSPP